MHKPSRGLAFGLLAVLGASTLSAQTQSVSPEFRVNTYTTGPQGSPSAAVVGTGDFVVVFSGQGEDGVQVHAQLFGQSGIPNGGPFRMNSATTGTPAAPAVSASESVFDVVWADGTLVKGRGFDVVLEGPASADTVLCEDVVSNKATPAIASDSNGGDFVVVWRSDLQDGSDAGIYGRRTEPSGQLFGPEFRVNTYTSGAQSAPKVAEAGDGSLFVVVWEGVRTDEDARGIFGQRFGGGGVPLGGEFHVNTTTTGEQTSPSVTTDGIGNFLVVWQSASGGTDVFGQRYARSGAPLGAEFRVNANPGVAASPSVGGLGANFTVVWQELASDGSANGIFARRFLSDGTPVLSEVRVNTYTTGDQTAPTIVPDARGSSVIVWTSDGQDGDQGGLYAARVSILNGDYRVNTYTTGAQGLPDVSADSVGNSVVVWISVGAPGNTWSLFGQRFGTTGQPAGGEFRVNASTPAYPLYPRVASAASGQFVVVWQDYRLGGISGRRFSAAGAPQGPEFRLTTMTTSAVLPAVASDAAGNFVVGWADFDTASVRAQRFSAGGTPLGPEFRVTPSTLNEVPNQRIAADASGNFVVVWHDAPDDGASSSGIFARRYDASGAPLAGGFRVNTVTSGNQYSASVAFGPAGDFVVVWGSYGVDGSRYGVVGQRFASSGAPLAGEFRVNANTPGNQENPLVTWRPQSEFLVAWSARDGSDYGVFGRRFAASGAPIGGDFALEGFGAGEQQVTSLTASPGRFVVVWHGGGDGSSYGIFMRRVNLLPNGDADGNGQVNVSDVLYLINYLFAGGPSPAGPADADGNGQINVSDVLYLINHLFAGGPAPA